MGFYCFPIKHISKMNGNTVQEWQSFLRTIVSSVQSSLGFSDTPLRVGYLQIFSVLRDLSPTRKSEKRVFFEIVWTSMVYLLLLNCTHRGRRTVEMQPRILPIDSNKVSDCVHTMLAHFENGEKCDGCKI